MIKEDVLSIKATTTKIRQETTCIYGAGITDLSSCEVNSYQKL